jgi:hypothetical protein
MAGTLSHEFAGAGRWLRKEFSELWPVFLFFLVGFLVLILLIKMAVAELSVEITVISKAVLGALLAAKAALILDDTPLSRNLEHYRGIVAIAVKVVVYGITCLLLLYAERFLEALHRFHNVDTAFADVFEQTALVMLLWALTEARSSKGKASISREHKRQRELVASNTI